jgi:hypothetical protein
MPTLAQLKGTFSDWAPRARALRRSVVLGIEALTVSRDASRTERPDGRNRPR